MPIQIPKRRGRSDIKELSELERRELYRIVQMPGYTILLDMMQRLCIEEETRLINAEPAQEKEVLAAHVMAKARWNFFVDVQARLEQEINDLFGTSKGPLVEGASEFDVMPPLDDNEA